MKKIRIFSFILSLVLSVSICGCTKKDDENRDESKATLVNKNGQYYIQLDDNAGNNASYDSSKIIQYIYFSSMDEFYSRVTESNFSEEEIDIMHGFSRDDNGIKVCDMDDLYQPVLPYNATVENIAWTGDEYTTLWSSTEVASGLFYVLDTENELSNTMERLCPDSFFDQEYVEVLDYSESQSNKYIRKTWVFTTTTEYGETKFRREQYESISNGRNYKAIVNYRIASTVDYGYEVKMSDTVPDTIYIFCNSGNKYWYNLITDVDDTIDIDWLMSFDIEPYVAE